MKTSKTKAVNRPKKTSESREAVKSEKVSTSKSGPSEEEIRKKAKEIYHERIPVGNMELQKMTGLKQKNC